MQVAEYSLRGQVDMASRVQIERFLSGKTIAIVGASREPQAFGHRLLLQLLKDRTVYPVNPLAESIAGIACYPSLRALPGPVDGAVIVVPAQQTESVVHDAVAAGVRRLWIQQRSETPSALKLCQDEGIEVISGECLFMFANPVGSMHKMHRFFRRLTGKLPH
jgi:uncharacterized protein